MSSFFIVKGELAAWALGLEPDEAVSEDDLVVVGAPPRAEPVKRRKWRRSHETYRGVVVRRRETEER